MKFLPVLALICGPALAQQTAAAPVVPAPAASPAPPEQPWLTGSLDLGYRWVTGVGGSFNTYRGIVDLGSGPKLLGADFTLTDPKRRVFDRVDVRAYNWGDDPYATFHLDARKAGLYEFSADYRNIAYYNNLPAFADPLLATTGVTLSEQSLDTRQRLGGFELDLLPSGRMVPYLAYQSDSNSGTGTATFVSGGDEFPVLSRIRDSANDFRAGVRLELSRLHATFEGGGTALKDDQQLNQNPGAINYGNFTAPLLGQTIDLTSLSQAYGVRGHSIYSKVLLTANAASWIDFYGQLLYSQPQSRVNFQQTDTGSQVVLSQALFYTGEQSVVAAESKMPHTSGSMGAEIRPLARLRILPSWLTDRMHSDGSDATRQNLAASAGATSITDLLSSAIVTNYSEAGLTVLYDLMPKLTVRAGYRYVWGNATDVILPIAELAGLDRGAIRRNVALAGFSWRPLQKLSLSGEFEDGSSGSNYFRTSLYDYQRVRLRARYQLLKTLSVSLGAGALNNHDPGSAIHYSFSAREESISFQYLPGGGRHWDVQGGYTRSALRSDIGYLDPEFLVPERSFYRDNSHTANALFDLLIPVSSGVTAKLSFGGSLFASSGSNPTRFFQPAAKLSVPFRKNASWVTEWRYYGFAEAFYLYQNFRSQTVTTGLRLTR